jgi:hypothetical protein
MDRSPSPHVARVTDHERPASLVAATSRPPTCTSEWTMAAHDVGVAQLIPSEEVSDGGNARTLHDLSPSLVQRVVAPRELVPAMAQTLMLTHERPVSRSVGTRLLVRTGSAVKVEPLIRTTAGVLVIAGAPVQRCAGMEHCVVVGQVMSRDALQTSELDC